MKLKMRFESKYMIRFGIFAAVLFVLVAIGISNLVCFSSTGSLCGISINYAFQNDYFLTTIVVYLITLIGLVASCKSFFFEMDKGFGFTTEKKMDGYSNWCDKKKMKSELKPVIASNIKANAGGIPLINDGKTLWVDDGEYHNLIIGSTGSGKTQCVIFPMVQSLCKHDESMLITDPKGEIYEKTSYMLRKKGYNIVLLNFRSPQQGNAWNPLTLPYHLWKEGNYEKAIELLDDLALNILYDEGNKNADPFWEKTSAGYFAGLSLAMFEDAKEEQININSINMMTTVGEEKCGGTTYIKEYFNSKDPNGAAYTNASSTLIAPSDTKGSILAVFKEKIKLFATRPNLSEMLSYSDFSIADIGKHKTAVFIVIQDEKKTYHSLATIFIKQVYETLIDVAYHNGGRLPVRTNFLLDEFANMPPLKDVTTMITAARSRLMRFTMIIQNFAQLNEVYGEQNAETIKGNCGNLVYLISTELKALEEISKMCGEVKTKKDDKVDSKPLITISDLQKMSMFEVIIRRVRLAPFKTKLTPDYKMNWGYSFPKVDLSKMKERDHHEVEVFDVREFVKAKREEKRNELMGGNNDGGALPFFGGSNPFEGSNPFAGSNPFSGGNPFENPNPFMNNNTSNPKFDSNSFDVDEIVRKIDEQIAKIEEEERLAKEGSSVSSNSDSGISEIINNPIEQEKNSDLVEKIFVDTPNEKTPDDIDDLDLNEIFAKVEKNLNELKQDEVKNDIHSNTEVLDNIISVQGNIQEAKIEESKPVVINTAKFNDDDYFDDFFEDE